MGDSGARTFYTSLADCLKWSVRLIGIVLLGTLAVSWTVKAIKGQAIPEPLSVLGNMSLALPVLSVVLGGLLFMFGWMGRVIVSRDGLSAPRYSGRRDFVHWTSIGRVESGSLNGWPCDVVVRPEPSPPLYVMVLGHQRRLMVEAISTVAPSGNPIRAYLGLRDA